MERLNSIAKRVHVGKAPPSRNESRAEREQFGRELETLAAAYRHELTDDAIVVYWRALKVIPVDIRTAGLTKCLQTIRFFPTVAEVLNACADVVDARRRDLAKEGQRIKAECEVLKSGRCDGVHRDSHTPQGNPCVIACDCHKAALALLAAAAPIARPRLAERSEVEA